MEQIEIIGTDVSSDVCKEEGYLMLEHDASMEFDRTEYYRVFRYYPDYCIGDVITEKKLMLDTLVSFDDLVEFYQEKKKELDSFTETGEHINFKNPTIYDLLNLASDIESYGGYFEYSM